MLFWYTSWVLQNAMCSVAPTPAEVLPLVAARFVVAFFCLRLIGVVCFAWCGLLLFDCT